MLWNEKEFLTDKDVRVVLGGQYPQIVKAYCDSYVITLFTQIASKDGMRRNIGIMINGKINLNWIDIKNTEPEVKFLKERVKNSFKKKGSYISPEIAKLEKMGCELEYRYRDLHFISPISAIRHLRSVCPNVYFKLG